MKDVDSFLSPYYWVLVYGVWRRPGTWIRIYNPIWVY